MSRQHGIALYLGALVFVTGCTTFPHQDQIVPTGHGTFIVPSRDFMGASSSSTDKAKAYGDATAYCMKGGKTIETVLTSENEGGFLEISAPLIEFRCVDAPKK
jgi:hypothetical protein